MVDFKFLPENILLDVLVLLDPQDILSCGITCKHWRAISFNDLLWKKVFLKYFNTIQHKEPGAEWRNEFLRIYFETPLLKLIEPYFIDNEKKISILRHRDQVLHVSFSHKGLLFATSSKDGFIKVWDMAEFPHIKLKFSFDLKFYNWKYTQYSCFNQNDTLLLVSGVHFGAQSTSGEIGVFNLIDGQFTLQCRVINRPYDVFGTWYNEDYLISGNLHWFGHLLSCSSLWINKAWQEIESENVAVVMQTFKFFNVNGSSVRNILICDCLEGNIVENDFSKVISPIQTSLESGESSSSSSSSSNCSSTSSPTSSQTSETNTEHFAHSKSNYKSVNSSNPYIKKSQHQRHDTSDDYRINQNGQKYLVFTTGSKTYAPHQIGIKRIHPILVPPVTAFHNDSITRQQSLNNNVRSNELASSSTSSNEETDLSNQSDPEERSYIEPNNNNSQSNLIYRGARLLPNDQFFQHYPEQIDFDSIDTLIELNGHIIGMTFSPDQRYLYVNVRNWPEDCVIVNPLNPPPISQEVKIRVIDMLTLKLLENTIYSSHKAYTLNLDCFFLFLDVCDDYIASGAEDKKAYIWDRNYDNLCVAKLPHDSIVNCVAFNPVNSQIMVTTTDDNLIHVKTYYTNQLSKKPFRQYLRKC